MINRTLINASLLTYSSELDEYGQPRQGVPTETIIQVTEPTLYKHTPVDDIRFESVTDTCLTSEKTINDSNELMIGTTKYLINFVNNSGRMTQLFLVKK